MLRRQPGGGARGRDQKCLQPARGEARGPAGSLAAPRPGDLGTGCPLAGRGWGRGATRSGRTLSPASPRETYRQAGGEQAVLGAAVPRATSRGAGAAACGRAAPMLSGLPAPEGARDRTASPPQRVTSVGPPRRSNPGSRSRVPSAGSSQPRPALLRSNRAPRLRQLCPRAVQ